MPRTIRFHLDEHVPKAVAEGLTQLGIDVTTARGVGRSGASDVEHLQFALQAGRVIFTQDDDFLRLHATGTPHAGIAYCRQGLRTNSELIQGLVLIWECYEPEDLYGRVEFL